LRRTSTDDARASSALSTSSLSAVWSEVTTWPDVSRWTEVLSIAWIDISSSSDWKNLLT
jgi:hypothetical protein